MSVNDESLELMQCTSTDPTQKSEVFEVDVDYPQWQGADIARWLPMLSPEDGSRGYYLGSMLLGNFVSDNFLFESCKTLPLNHTLL